MGRRLEVVLLLAVLGVCGAIGLGWFATTSPAARKRRCLENLRCINRALVLYRQDWATKDAGTPEEMGLPPHLPWLVTARRADGTPYLPEGERVLHCPDVPEQFAAHHSQCDYGFNVWRQQITPGVPGGPPIRLPSYAATVRRRGARFPILYDHNHNPPPDRPTHTRQVLIGRLDGTVVEVEADQGGGSWSW